VLTSKQGSRSKPMISARKASFRFHKLEHIGRLGKFPR